jgi:hypothetical protein
MRFVDVLPRRYLQLTCFVRFRRGGFLYGCRYITLLTQRSLLRPGRAERHVVERLDARTRDGDSVCSKYCWQIGSGVVALLCNEYGG